MLGRSVNAVKFGEMFIYMGLYSMVTHGRHDTGSHNSLHFHTARFLIGSPSLHNVDIPYPFDSDEKFTTE